MILSIDASVGRAEEKLLTFVTTLIAASEVLQQLHREYGLEKCSTTEGSNCFGFLTRGRSCSCFCLSVEKNDFFELLVPG